MLHRELDVLGVVLYTRGLVVELAVWPCSRLDAHPSQLEHLTSAHACPRSFGDRLRFDDATAAAIAHNRCRPRARDGRCHWCDRVLEADELVGPKTATLWKERTVHVEGLGVLVITGGEARLASTRELIAKATTEGRWRIVSGTPDRSGVGTMGPRLALRLLDALRRSESADV